MYREYFGYKVYDGGKVIGKRGQIMSPSYNGRGYLILGIMVGSKRVTKAVHRIVAECFVENPNNYLEVNHKDGDKLNNCKDNLEWVSRSENLKHAYKQELRSAKGENNSRCLTSEQTVKEICTLLQQGFSSSQIRDKGYKYNLVRSIKRKQTWKHISKDYTF